MWPTGYSTQCLLIIIIISIIIDNEGQEAHKSEK